MSSENHDKLNRLLGRQGSLVERFKLARELDDDLLQIAASANIPQAKEELERRRHERLLAAGAPSGTKETEKGQETLGKTANDEFTYVDTGRIGELRGLSSRQFDLARLIRFCEELNVCYRHECYFAVATLTRAFLDHIPPIFRATNFSQVASNYPGTKSFKDSMQHLENSSRKIADAHLHSQIRKKETLPNKTQVNFSNDLDVLLAEIVRILKGK